MNSLGKEWLVYIGTYSEPSSEGIVWARVNPVTGEIRRAGGISGIANPSYLTADAARQRLYAVSETDRSTVVSFRVDPATGALARLNERPTNGAAGCHVHLDADRSCLLAANYSGCNAVAFPILEDGTLGEGGSEVRHEGSGPNRERQEMPHPHCIVTDPSNRFAFVADLGIDQVVVYRLDAKAAKLTRHGSVSVKPGAGPRHLVFHPDKPFAYLINEIDSTVTVFHYDAEEGRLEERQTVSALAAQQRNTSAAIHLSPDGRFLYASNRGEDSIAVFRIDGQEGTLARIETVSSGGRTPRDFRITPDGKFLLAANQDSNNIAVFTVNSETGRLERTVYGLELPKPVCVQFYG